MTESTRRLERVEPAVRAAAHASPPRRSPKLRSSRAVAATLGVVRDDRAAVAERAEVLGRIEAERRRGAERAGPPAAQRRAVRLRGVLEHDEPVLAGECGDRVHVGALAVEVHRDDRLRARGRGALGSSPGVEREPRLVDVDEHRRRTRGLDPGDRGDARVRRA